MSKNLISLISFVMVLGLVTGVSGQTPDDLEIWAEYLFDGPDPCADTGGHGFDITELGAGATVGVSGGVTGTAYHGDIGDYNAVLCAYEYTPYATLPAGAWPGDTETGDFTIEMTLYFDEEWVTTDLCGGEKSWAWYAQRNLSAGGELWGFMQEGGSRDEEDVYRISDSLWWDGRTDMIGYISEDLDFIVKETWYHWVVSVDNTNHTIRHWIDGVPVITEMPDHSKKPSDFSGPVSDLYLGASLYDDPGGWHPFRGRIDELRFYKGYTEIYPPPLVPTVPSPKATRPDPKNGAENVSRPVTLSWTQGIFVGDVNGHEVYFGTTFADVNDANRTTPGIFRGPNDVYSYLVDPCDPNTIKYAYDVLDTLDLGKTYYWRVDEVNESYVPGPNEPNAPPDGRWKGNIWNFTVEGQALNPFPTDGADEVPKNVTLSWTPGAEAGTHDVYIGTSFTAVDDANTNTAGIFKGNQSAPNYPATLEPDATYYWRIDEVNTVTVKGNIWSFEVAPYTVVENFDSYATTEPDLYAVWNDGWVNLSDATISIEKSPFLARDGNSMAFDYSNTRKSGGKYVGSEADATTAALGVSSDWTAVGIKALVLYFYGKAGNSATVNDQLYAALDDGSSIQVVEYDGDMNDVAEESWHEWNIDLQDFNALGTNLTNVTKLMIGLGGYARTGQGAAGGSGTLYFDDIRLWTTRCMRAYALGDVTGDCVIDEHDIDAMGVDWLVSDFAVPPEEPCDANLIVHYTYDTDYSDSSGAPYYHGQASPSGSSVSGGVLSLDGVGYVDIPFGAANPFGGTQDFSIAMWFKTSVNGLLISSSEPNDTSGCEMSMNVYLGNVKNPGGVLYDNINIGWMGGGTLLNDGQWHHMVTTYDTSTLQHHIYADGMLETWADLDGVWDPNITDIATHTVRIGYTYCDNALASTARFVGDIDDVRIYDYPLTLANALWLVGEVNDVYFGLDSAANLVPKTPDDQTYDANNPDIVNLIDYSIMADHWLEGPTLWP